MITRGVRFLCFAIALLVISSLPASAAASGVRIVRLSVAQGDVQIDRNAGAGWEQAINNMPVIGGARIFAGDNSKAEIEFEDGSSVRLAGPAQVALKELSFSANGAPVTHIEIDSGIVYVDARLKDHADFLILTSTGESLDVTQPSRLRFKIDEQVASLSVTEGQVEIPKEDGGNTTLHAGQTYNYILGQPNSSVLSATVPQQSEDSWNQQRESYNDQSASAGVQYSGTDDQNAPGVADLGSYGSYDNVPDCGDCWQPAGVGPDWNPYDNGAWSYYDDWGWTFVSGYPWGWAPYYYGSWFYVGGRGWWWRPGPWHGPHGGPWHPLPLLANTPHGFNAPHPPAHVTHGTVAVAGSNLRVGPIARTHAVMAARAPATAAPSVGANAAARPGPTSNFVHTPAESDHGTPFITGMKGTYRLSNPTVGGRNGFQAYRSSSGATPHVEGYSSASPRTYAYSGSSAPRSYSVPSAAIPHASSSEPHVSAEPHVSEGGGSFHSSGGGEGFHGGGGGGGGFHGGGGGGGHR